MSTARIEPPSDRAQMQTLKARAAVALLALLAIPSVALAFAAVVGAGALRRGGPLLVTLGALALVVLPALAPAGFVRRVARPPVILASLLAWSLCALAGFPLFFPGERADAIGTGIAIVGFPASVEDAARAVERQLPTLGHARPPPPAARRLDPLAADSRTKAPVELATELVGSAITVSVRIEGSASRASTYRMLLDTGASFTTLSHRALGEIGIAIDPESPTVTLGTAAGDVQAHLVLLDRIRLNDVEIPGVTVAVCDPCESHGVAGLLGLNVLGQFLVTLDSAHQRVLLERRAGSDNRALDVAPWLKVHALATTWLDGRVEVDVSVVNAADRLIGVAEIAVRCDTTYVADLRDIPRRGTASTLVTLPRGARCDDYTAPLERATW